MGFCIACGGRTAEKTPKKDIRVRSVCVDCGHIHYENPKVIVSCLAYIDNRVVWVKRAEQPRRGFWVIPAGFLENMESLAEGAARELYEETQLRVKQDSMALYTLGTLQHTREVYIVFRGELESVDSMPNHEVLDIGLFQEQDAPWADLAYPIMEKYLRRFYKELKQKAFSPYIGDFSQEGDIIWDIT